MSVELAANEVLPVTTGRISAMTPYAEWVSDYVLTLISRTPTTATCKDVPGEVDYILTSSDINAINISKSPFGANISLDGVHPSAQGQTILATAAVQAINARYGLAIP